MPLPPPRKKVLPPPRKSVEPAAPKRNIKKSAEQQDLLSIDTDWQSEWKGMPEFKSEKIMPFHTLYVHFEKVEDINKFSELIGIKINTEIKEVKYTPRLWFPGRENLKVAKLRYKSDK